MRTVSEEICRKNQNRHSVFHTFFMIIRSLMR